MTPAVGIVHIQPAGVHDDLAGGVHFDVRAVHRPRRGPFEVDAFGVVPAAVARALEFVFAGLPFRSAAQVGAARKDHEDAVGFAHHPDAIGHQEALIDAQAEVRGIADGENGVGFVERARKEEPQEHQEVDAEIAAHRRPDHAPAHPVRRRAAAAFQRRLSQRVLPVARAPPAGLAGETESLSGFGFDVVRHI